MKTNYQLIKIQDKFILVSDEETQKDDFKICLNDNMIFKYMSKASIESDTLCKDCKKIIAGIPELPSIDFSLLSEEYCKIIGWVDVEKLAIKIVPNKTLKTPFGSPYEITPTRERNTFIKGFKTAQSLNDKMLENEIFDTQIQVVGDNKTQSIRTFIQSLQQTSWDVEVNKLNQIIKIT